MGCTTSGQRSDTPPDQPLPLARVDDTVQKLYDIQDKLGSGNYGVVKRAVRRSDGRPVALKIVNKDGMEARDLAALRAEVSIMKQAHHPNIAQLYDCLESKNFMYLVLELCAGGELLTRINDHYFSEDEARNCIVPLAAALAHLHSHGIVHRDIKPENILYLTAAKDSPVKIVDFGFAKVRESNEMLKTTCGTPEYVAPEVLTRQGYTPAVDVWSLGVILYTVLCGRLPFSNPNRSALYKMILRGDYAFNPRHGWDRKSDEAKDLVRRMMCLDPRRRITAAEILEHPWAKQSAAAPSRAPGKLPGATSSTTITSSSMAEEEDKESSDDCTPRTMYTTSSGHDATPRGEAAAAAAACPTASRDCTPRDSATPDQAHAHAHAHGAGSLHTVPPPAVQVK